VEILITSDGRNKYLSLPTDEELAGAKNFFLEQEEGFPSFPWNQQRQLISWLGQPPNPLPAVQDEDPEPNPKNFYSEEEGGYQSGLQFNPWLSRPALDDEISTSLKNFFREEEGGYQSVKQSVPWKITVVVDEEEFAKSKGVAGFGITEEDFLPEFKVQSNPWTKTLFTDEDSSANLKNFFLENEEGYQSVQQAQPWLKGVYLDDDVIRIVAVNRYEEEYHWTAQTEKIVWTSRAFQDEDARAKGFPLEDELHHLTLQQKITWTNRVVSDEDGLHKTLRVEDEYWIAQVQSVRWTNRPSLDDEIGSSLKSVRIDEEYPWLDRRQQISWRTTIHEAEEWQVPYVAPPPLPEPPSPYRPKRSDEGCTDRPRDDQGCGTARFRIDSSCTNRPKPDEPNIRR